MHIFECQYASYILYLYRKKRTADFLYFLRPISVLFCEYVLENVKNNIVVGVEWV